MCTIVPSRSVHGENRSSVTDEPVEFEKRPVEGQDFRRITYHSRGIYGRCLNSIQENRKMSTGRTGRQLQMNRWSLRNDRSEFKTSGELPIILEESMEDASNP